MFEPFFEVSAPFRVPKKRLTFGERANPNRLNVSNAQNTKLFS
jgi:hypothetical protein